MALFLDFLHAAGPALAGILTVPVLQGLKAAWGRLDHAPAIVKQTIGVVVAFFMVKLGAFLSVSLPGDVALFTGDDIEAAIAAAIAFAVHAGRKASTNAVLRGAP